MYKIYTNVQFAVHSTVCVLQGLLTILLRVDVLEPLSETGSKDASGEVPGEVDIGDPAVSSVPADVSSRSRNGFLLLFGDVNGLERPMVANFWPLFMSSAVVAVVMNGLVKGFVAGTEKESENKVSFWIPAKPFWEKWVTLTGS